MKTALVVEGGGLRGAFAVGALRILLSRVGAGFFEDVIAVSSGVFAATYYVANQGEEMEATWRTRVSGDQLVNYWHAVSGRPILGLDYLIGLFRGPVRLNVDAVIRSRSNLEYVLTDFVTGHPAYVSAKSETIFDLMRASSALPRVYPIPVVIGGHPYYDGGQSDPIPIKRAIALGARRVVVVRTRPSTYQKAPRSRRLARFLLPTADVARAGWLSVHETYNASVRLIEHPPEGVRVISIAPDQLRLGRLSRSRRRIVAAIEHGKEVAERVLAEQDAFFVGASQRLSSART